MDLYEYARVLFRRAWLIVVIAAVGALGALAFSRIQTPVYRSTVTLSAVPTRHSDYGQTLAIKNLLRLYSQQLQTETIAQQVVDQLQLDIPAQKFRSEVAVSPNEADYTLLIEVKDPNIDMVQRMVQTLAETFVIQHDQENLEIDQNDRILVNILDNATPPEKFSPKTTINVAAGGILGALAGAVVVFLVEFLQSGYIRRADDVERALKLTVLGAIPTISSKEGGAARSSTARRWFWQRA
jgi:capsular polysaccharide biosynthesis protein